MEYLSLDFARQGLLAAIAVALACALLSFFVVLRRLAFIGQGISHAAFGGLGIAAVLGLAPLATDLTILGFCTIAALAMGAHSPVNAEHGRTPPSASSWPPGWPPESCCSPCGTHWDGSPGTRDSSAKPRLRRAGNPCYSDRFRLWESAGDPGLGLGDLRRPGRVVVLAAAAQLHFRRGLRLRSRGAGAADERLIDGAFGSGGRGRDETRRIGIDLRPFGPSRRDRSSTHPPLPASWC